MLFTDMYSIKNFKNFLKITIETINYHVLDYATARYCSLDCHRLFLI